MKKLFLFIALLIVPFWGCEYFENSKTINSASLEVNITGLPVLADTMAYVAWFDTDDRPAIFIKRITPNSKGDVYFKEEQKLANLDSAQIFLITVEPIRRLNEPNFTASNRIILSGRFSNGLCNLTLGENFKDFKDTYAKYTLYTPTDGDLNSNPFGGIWFVDSVDANKVSAGLNLPVLYAGWIYEGWIELGGNKLSTGRFRNPRAADLFNGHSATAASVPFPGEDFINNPTAGFTFPLNLRGAKSQISIELNDGRNRGTSPGIIIYEANIPNDAISLKSYSMTLTNNIYPKGAAIIKIDLIK